MEKQLEEDEETEARLRSKLKKLEHLYDNGYIRKGH